MSLNSALAMLCALAMATCAVLFNRYEAVKARADAAEAALVMEKANAKIVEKFVDRIVKVPGPSVVRERLIAGVCHTFNLPSPANPDGAAGTDPGNRQTDPARELAADLAASARNKAKLEALQAVLQPQVNQ